MPPSSLVVRQVDVKRRYGAYDQNIKQPSAWSGRCPACLFTSLSESWINAHLMHDKLQSPLIIFNLPDACFSGDNWLLVFETARNMALFQQKHDP